MEICISAIPQMAEIWRISTFRHIDYGGNMADNGFMAKYPHLSAQKIPWELQYTDKLVKLLMRIARTKPYLEEYLGQPLELHLLRQAQIRAITFSNQIEGNRLEERGVTQILEVKKHSEMSKDEVEVLNYRDALEYANTLSAEKGHFKLRDLCDLQKLVTRDTLSDKKQSGALRSIQVNIIDASTGKKIDDCPEPHFLPSLMEELWEWLADHQETDPFVKAFAFHYIAVAVHPFADGNGRTMRLAQHLLLLKGGEEIARFVPSETAIMATRARYYASIRQCKALNSLNPIVEYLAECFATAAEEVFKESKKLIRTSLGRKPEARYAKILSLSKQKKEFSIQDVIGILGEVPRRTLERDLETLVHSKQIKATGEKRARVYSKHSKK